MKRLINISLYSGGLVTLVVLVYFTFKVVQYHPAISYDLQPLEEGIYRIVFISGDSGSPFWNSVKHGVEQTASLNKAAIEFKETFHADFGEYLKNIDMAIASKVDGIIVQGKENPEFIRMINKASQKGIAVITVFTDAPDSLRKSYVGPNHYQEGIMIGQHIAAQAAEEGQACLVYGAAPVGYLSLRRQGVEEALARYGPIPIVEADFPDASARNGLEETTELLNQYPECRVIVSMTAEAVDGIVQVIKSRSRIGDYSLYTFDQSLEVSQYIDNEIILAAFFQYPELIGMQSMQYMLRWLEGKDNPLERNYFTPVELVGKKGAIP